jgi:uncharacterized protein YkwD
MALTLAGCRLTEPGASMHSPGRSLARSSAPLDHQKIRDAISSYRESNGLARVVDDPVLQQAAQHQANAMAETGRLDHSVEGAFAERVAAIGRASSHAVENLSVGRDSFAAAFSSWRQSELHNQNLLDPHVTRMGIGKADASGATYWALIMTD